MKIAVFFGGNSAERDVSIASGFQVITALRKIGHEVISVDTARGLLTIQEEQQLIEKGVDTTPFDGRNLSITHEQANQLTKATRLKSVDVVFLALHGGTGEDGTIQAFLDLAGLPYTGSGHKASANAMDKDISKQLFRYTGVPTANWLMMPVSNQEIIDKIGLPAVIKSNKQGSTVGLTIVKKPEDIEAAIQKAYLHDDEVMIEKYIDGRELTVGILDETALSVGEIIPKCSDHFDYESKYQVGGAEEIFPADLSEEETELIKELGLKAHKVLKLEGYSRVDFRLDTKGQLWCLEANTLPGMTATSLLPQSANVLGIDFPNLCEKICQLAIAHFEKSLL
ncbi:MAG: D-alanine--D-alanine ligase [Deltaproteobacteria bacterium]|jgi:D-alanine-D-alanine ligase|nr:D-alanine--D-alanine ligase [Deltaproteobacteria bacterium]MBT4527717.1 D-alanine--D-alanine ligase [Deltaproteobacteria bacterium]